VSTATIRAPRAMPRASMPRSPPLTPRPVPGVPGASGAS